MNRGRNLPIVMVDRLHFKRKVDNFQYYGVSLSLSLPPRDFSRLQQRPTPTPVRFYDPGRPLHVDSKENLWKVSFPPKTLNVLGKGCLRTKELRIRGRIGLPGLESTLPTFEPASSDGTRAMVPSHWNRSVKRRDLVKGRPQREYHRGK